MSEAPNQEGHLFADALSLAVPDVRVYVRSEKPQAQERGEELESFYRAFIEQEMPSDYVPMRHMAADAGWAVRALDERGRFFAEQPKRKKGEDPDEYNGKVDEYRQDAGLPLCVRDIDPLGFYPIENTKRDEVIFGMEVRRIRESEIKDGGEYTTVGDFLAIRTPEMIYHFWTPAGAVGAPDSSGSLSAGAKELYRGKNRFGHTGYFLYRGRYTGSENPQLRYQPYIMATLNVAQVKGLFTTIHANLAIRASVDYIEHDMGKTGDSMTPEARAVTLKKKAESRGASSRTAGGTIAADFEPGAHLKSREMPQELQMIVQTLESEEQRYRFNDILSARDVSTDMSGRAFIRMWEAAGNQLTAGLRAREQTTKEILTIVRKTIFGPTYLGAKEARPIYIQFDRDGQGDAGDMRMQDMLAITPEHNIPHSIKVDVSQQSQAARLAMLEEGMKLTGTLSQDTIDEEFYQLKDKQLENRRRVKDQVREGVLPQAVSDGVQQALAKLGKMPIPDPSVVMPPAEPTGGTSAVQAAAGPEPVMAEQAAMQMNGSQALGY